VTKRGAAELKGVNQMCRPRFDSTLSVRSFGLIFLLLLVVPFPILAQKNEITLSLGGTPSQSPGFRSPTAGTAQTSADISLGANYGHRFLDAGAAALYGEIEFVALPNRSLAATTATVPQNYASLYVTPGVRLKILPSSRLSPWVAAGGGYALYEQSARLSNGQSTTNKFLSRGVFDFGGGLDYRLYRFIGLRGEVRDFLSGNPNLNVALSSSTQHNVVASGGISVRF
jgi:hypothetical protein